MPMAENKDWLIRLGLTNFDANVFNTQDLSTIRGASMTADAGAHYIASLLKKWCKAGEIDVTPAPGAAAGGGRTTQPLSGPLRCKRLFAGSSEAELTVRDATRDDVAKLCAAARQHLRDTDAFTVSHPYYRKESYEPGQGHFLLPPTEHLTFCLDFEEIIGRDEAGARYRLTGEPCKPEKLARRAGREPSVTWLEPVDLASDPDLRALDSEKRRPSARCPIDPMRVVGGADRLRGAWILTRPGQIPDPPGGKAIRIHQTTTSEQVRVSQRVSDLRNFGRTARRDLYVRQLGDHWKPLKDEGFLRNCPDSFDLVQSFPDMVAHPPKDLRPSLRNKIAVLYFDGNGWGDLVRHYAKLGGERTREMTKAAEDTFAAIYAHLLRRFMEGAADPRYAFDPRAPAMSPHTAFSIINSIHVPDIQSDGRDYGGMEERHLLRLETLMIGGEDMVIVCPSWLAFEVVETVFGVVADRENALQAGMNDWPPEDGPPRHFSMRCGAVIADKGMPIRRAKDLAWGLNESLKDWDAAKNERKKGTVTENMVQFHILESLDVPDRGDADASIRDERRRLFPEARSDKDFHLSGAALADLRANLKTLRERTVLPRSQLFRWLRLARDEHCSDTVRAAMEDTLKTLDYRLKADQLTACLPGPADADLVFRLKLLADYWDYAWPFDNQAGAAFAAAAE